MEDAKPAMINPMSIPIDRRQEFVGDLVRAIGIFSVVVVGQDGAEL